MTRRVLFCWEIGEGSGHVRPYLSLLSALAARGWEVGLALRNTSAADDGVRARFPVFQAPVCQNEFSGIAASPANHTELYLGVGFAHRETLAALAGAWRGLMDLWKPDLILANNAPVALLAAFARRTPAVRIGTGFECPPGGRRPPLLQPWQPELEPRLERAESLALRNANAVLKEQGSAGAASLSAILYDVPTLLTTVPDFDPFKDRPATTQYLGVLPDEAGRAIADAKAPEILAYLRLQHRHTREALAAIARSGRSALAVVPDASEAECLSLSAKGLEVRREPVDMGTVLPRCTAFVGYASHGATLAALLAGKPMLLLPDHAEQRSTARQVVALGAGVAIDANDRGAKLASGLKRVLEDPAFTKAARRFAEAGSREAGPGALDRAVDAIERVQTPASPQLRVVGQ